MHDQRDSGRKSEIARLRARITKLEAERDRMLAQLRQQQKIEAIRTLAGGVAHEINNPINIVMNYAELIISRAPAGDQVADFAREIVEESQRIATIVRDLLSFAREDQEHSEESDVADVVGRACTLMGEVFRKNDVELLVDIPDGLAPVPCQPPKLQQVIMNLMANCLDAFAELDDDRKKRLEITATALADDERHVIRIALCDNGPGVRPDIVERIFDPFFTTKPRDRGTGLGLSVSRNIVEDAGGTLSFESLPDERTCFRIELPVEE